MEAGSGTSCSGRFSVGRLVTLTSTANNCNHLGDDLTRPDLVHQEKAGCNHKGLDYLSFMGVADRNLANNPGGTYLASGAHLSIDNTARLWEETEEESRECGDHYGGRYPSKLDLYVRSPHTFRSYAELKAAVKEWTATRAAAQVCSGTPRAHCLRLPIACVCSCCCCVAYACQASLLVHPNDPADLH